ncbi:MAG: glycosyltransferase family 2 protein [Rhodobacteraceae bacterium]|nr:glycosyltransferase family 2 protein [Paracoccaceae bacterium]
MAGRKKTAAQAGAEMRLALVMMQKDEGPLLDSWLRYHERLTTPDLIHVFDNGSTDARTLEILDGARARGICVNTDFPTNADYQIKNTIMVDHIRSLQAAGCDFVIPLDCDEFLICKPRPDQISFRPDVLRKVIAGVLELPGHFTMLGSYYNALGAGHQFQLAAERHVCFGRSPVTRMDHGYHIARTDEGSKHQIALAVLHFQSKRPEIGKRQATEKLRKRVADFSRETLLAYSGPGAHMRHWFLPKEGAGPGQVPRQRGLPEFHKVMKAVGAPFPFELFFDEDRYAQSRAETADDPYLARAVEQGLTEKEALLIHKLCRGAGRVLFYGPQMMALSVARAGAGAVDVLSLSKTTLGRRLPEAVLHAEPKVKVTPVSLRVEVDGFGTPKTPPPRQAVLTYVERAPDAQERPVDVAVLNGRYRVACIASLVLANPRALIVIPNFWSRSYVHAVLKFCGCVDTEGDMVVLRRDPEVPDDKLRRHRDAHLRDPR